MAQLSIGINVLAPAPLLPLIMEEYSLDRSTASILFVVMALMLAVGNVPSGFLAARFGIHRTFAFGAFLMSVGMLAPFMPNFAGHVAWRVVFAFGAGVVIPLVGAVASQWFDRRELPVVNGINWMGQTGGMAISLVIAVPIAKLFSWDITLFIFGAVALVGAIAWVVLGKEPAEDRVSVSSPSIPKLLGILRERTTILVSLAFVGPFLAYLSFSSWLPTYYNEVFGFSLEKASSIVAIPAFVGLVVSPVAGLASAKLGLRRPFLIGAGILFIFSGFGTFLFNNQFLIYASVVALGISQWVFISTVFTVATELPQKSAQEIAMVLAAGLAVGNLFSLAGPVLVGTSTDFLGTYLPSLSLLALFPITMVIAGVLLPETGPGRAAIRKGPGKPEGLRPLKEVAD